MIKTEMKPIVYAVHAPQRWDYMRRCMEPLDLSPAAEHGELRIIFPGSEPPPQIDDAVAPLGEALANFRACDYLLIAGHMELLVWASFFAATACDGRLSLLKWDNRRRKYEVCPPPSTCLLMGKPKKERQRS